MLDHTSVKSLNIFKKKYYNLKNAVVNSDLKTLLHENLILKNLFIWKVQIEIFIYCHIWIISPENSYRCRKDAISQKLYSVSFNDIDKDAYRRIHRKFRMKWLVLFHWVHFSFFVKNVIYNVFCWLFNGLTKLNFQIMVHIKNSNASKKDYGSKSWNDTYQILIRIREILNNICILLTIELVIFF